MFPKRNVCGICLYRNACATAVGHFLCLVTEDLCPLSTLVSKCCVQREVVPHLALFIKVKFSLTKALHSAAGFVFTISRCVSQGWACLPKECANSLCESSPATV